MPINIPQRKAVIQDIKSRGGMVAAVLPIHYPRALLRAFNIFPVEVWGPPRVDVSLGGSQLQSYVCAIVQNALSFIKMGALEIADLILIPHTCDSLQGLTSLLIDMVKPPSPVFPLYLPRGRREEDVIFLAEELQSLYAGLAELTGRRPTDAELLAAIAREELCDQLSGRLYEQRQTLGLGNLDFYRLLRSREYLPAEEFAALAESALAVEAAPLPGTPLLLSGILPEPMMVLDLIEEMKGLVVADDFAGCGRRLYRPGLSPEPFRRLAESLVAAPPDPTRGNAIGDRVQFLVEMAAKTYARGVIFYEVKFCEPELFDLPELRAALKERGLVSLHIEVDINNPLPQQTATRIGAFLEMLNH